MANVQIIDNSAAVLSAVERAKARALEIIGGKCEAYAKQLCAPRGPLGNPMRREIMAQLRNSITHRANGDIMQVGSGLDMAAYVELGTGNKYEPAPGWIASQVQQGPNSGMSRWFFYDEEQQRVRVGLPMSPTPFLRPAVENHVDEYKYILQNELKNA